MFGETENIQFIKDEFHMESVQSPNPEPRSDNSCQHTDMRIYSKNAEDFAPPANFQSKYKKENQGNPFHEIHHKVELTPRFDKSRTTPLHIANMQYTGSTLNLAQNDSSREQTRPNRGIHHQASATCDFILQPWSNHSAPNYMFDSFRPQNIYPSDRFSCTRQSQSQCQKQCSNLRKQNRNKIKFHHGMESEPSIKKTRGNYKCTKCGEPKKGHNCPMDAIPIPIDRTLLNLHPSHFSSRLPSLSLSHQSSDPSHCNIHSKSLDQNNPFPQRLLQTSNFQQNILQHAPLQSSKPLVPENGLDHLPSIFRSKQNKKQLCFNIVAKGDNLNSFSPISDESSMNLSNLNTDLAEIPELVPESISRGGLENKITGNEGKRVFILDTGNSWLNEIDVNDENSLQHSGKSREKRKGETSTIRGERVRKELTFSLSDVPFSNNENIKMIGKRLDFGSFRITKESNLENIAPGHGASYSLQNNRISKGNKVFSPTDKCLLIILSKLSPIDLIAASFCCKKWRSLAKQVWKTIESVSLILNEYRNTSYFHFVLQNSPILSNITLKSYIPISDILLQSICSTCFSLKSLAIKIVPGVNSFITGEGISHLIQSCQHLESIEIDGCENIYKINFVNENLKKLFLFSCPTLAHAEIRCPNLVEICLDFMDRNLPCVTNLNLKSKQNPYYMQEHAENSQNKMLFLFEQISESCSSLKKIHVSSPFVNDEVVRAMLSQNQLNLEAFSLTFSSLVTDDSSVEIARQCRELEVLDLSACSNISDVSLNILCRAFKKSLKKLLVAGCPNVTVTALQSAVNNLPSLILLDCGNSLLIQKELYTCRLPNLSSAMMLASSSHISAIFPFQRNHLHHHHSHRHLHSRHPQNPSIISPNSISRTQGNLFGIGLHNIALEEKYDLQIYGDVDGSRGNDGDDNNYNNINNNSSENENDRSNNNYSASMKIMHNKFSGPHDWGLQTSGVFIKQGLMTNKHERKFLIMSENDSDQDLVGDDDDFVHDDRILKICNPMLQKLSLWGCTALQGLVLECPALIELNLRNCSNLKALPSCLRLNCPSLTRLEASGCPASVITLLDHFGFSDAIVSHI